MNRTSPKLLLMITLLIITKQTLYAGNNLTTMRANLPTELRKLLLQEMRKTTVIQGTLITFRKEKKHCRLVPKIISQQRRTATVVNSASDLDISDVFIFAPTPALAMQNIPPNKARVD